MFNKKRICLLSVEWYQSSQNMLIITLHVLLAQPQKILTLRAITFKNGCNSMGLVRFEPVRAMPKVAQNIPKNHPPRFPTRVAGVTLSDETKKALNIPLYILSSKASDWSDLTKTMKDCFASKQAMSLKFEKLYQAHLDAFDCLQKKKYKESSTGFIQYSQKLYKFYKHKDTKDEARILFNQARTGAEKDVSQSELKDQVEIATNKMASKKARELGRLEVGTEDDYSDIADSQESVRTSASSVSNFSDLSVNYHPARTLKYELVASSSSDDDRTLDKI